MAERATNPVKRTLLNGGVCFTPNAGQMHPDRECVSVSNTRLPTVWFASCFIRLNCFFIFGVSPVEPPKITLQMWPLVCHEVRKASAPCCTFPSCRYDREKEAIRPQSQLKIVCSLASSRANRSSVEILRESSSRWRHDPRTSLFVRIHALKFQSEPRGTFTGSDRLPLLFPCVALGLGLR